MFSTKVNHFFLSKNQVNKIKIFYIMIEEKYINTLHLGEMLGLSIRSTKNIMEEITEEIAFYNRSNESLQLTYCDNVYCWDSKLCYESCMKIVYQLKKDYYIHSSFYKSLLFMVIERSCSLKEFSEELSYSQSYSYKLIDRLNEFFQVTHLSLKVVKEKKQFELVGDELEIRQLNYYLIVTIYNGAEWPEYLTERSKIANTQKYLQLEKYHHLSPSNQLKKDLLLEIFQEAIESGFKIQIISQRDRELYESFVQDSDRKKLFSFLQNKYCLKTSDNHNESCCFELLSYHVIPELIDRNEKIRIGQRLIKSCHNHELLKGGLLFLDKICTHYFLTNEEIAVFFMDLITKSLILKNFHFWKFYEMSEQAQKNKNIPNQLFYDLEKFIGNYFRKTERSHCITYLANICYYNLLVMDKKVLKIYTEFYYKSSYKEMIEQFILSTYNNKKVTITPNFNEADVIISDGIAHHMGEQADFFYFSDSSNPKNWEELGNFLQKQLIGKNIM